jgi:DNA-3-methyladenine glycosylase
MPGKPETSNPDARSSPRLSRSFYRRNPVAVARGLLGHRLVSQIGGARTSGLIVETEAYLGIPDKGAHTYGGRRTPRSETMWGDGGYAYVYFVYGMHHCFNVVAGRAGNPVAVLIRALEPCASEAGSGSEPSNQNLDVLFARREKAKRFTDLCSGPSKLCQALNITRDQDGEDLIEGDLLFIERARSRSLPQGSIVAGPRIGIAYAEEWQHEPLRFFLEGNPHVS